MLFRKTIAHRLFSISRTTPALTNCRTASPCTAAMINHETTPYNLALDSGDDGNRNGNGILRRYLHRHSETSTASRPFLRTGEKLLEKLRGMDIARDRIRLDGLTPSAAAEESPEGKITVADAKKILKLSQLERMKSKLRTMEKDCVSYKEYLEICGEECFSLDQGLEFAKILDESGNVIVLGNIVFLRPDQVVKGIQELIPLSMTSNDDPRTKELEEMEKQKAAIDTKAKSHVRRELMCGLGFLVVQTATCMRLTFWELSWDVMEPICFYVTSMYFMGGYAFFLRTSKEPSFEGVFQSRFSAKQRRLIKARNFDVERYNELKKACSRPILAGRENNELKKARSRPILAGRENNVSLSSSSS